MSVNDRLPPTVLSERAADVRHGTGGQRDTAPTAVVIHEYAVQHETDADKAEVGERSDDERPAGSEEAAGALAAPARWTLENKQAFYQHHGEKLLFYFLDYCLIDSL